ncbi:MAG: GAF domain-containing protein, partial [Fibrobacterota bacterium]
MNNNTRILFLPAALLFLAGILAGCLHFIPALLLLFTAAGVAYFFFAPPVTAAANGKAEKNDDPPDFVREEVLEGTTDTSMRALTPEYKRKIRIDIEEVILDALGGLLELLKAFTPYHTAAFFRRGKTDVAYLFLYNSDSPHILLGEAVTYGSGLVGQIMKEKEGKVVREGDIRAPSTTLLYYKENESVRSFLGVPVTVEGVCRGALILDSKEQNAFDPRAQQVAERIAHVAGTIQYYAYLQLENKIDRNKVTALSSLQRNFFTFTSEQEVLGSLGSILDTLVASVRVTVSLEAGKRGYGKIYHIRGTDADYFKDYEFPFSERGLISLVFERNALVRRKFEPSRYVPRFSVREKVNHAIQSIIAVPIPSSNGDATLGV